jgi:parallel beta-helix repeat protein
MKILKKINLGILLLCLLTLNILLLNYMTYLGTTESQTEQDVFDIIIPKSININANVEIDDFSKHKVLKTVSSPITITNDNELASIASLGDGTQENPYILENYYIQTTGTTAISVSNTNSHFIIKNSLFSFELPSYAGQKGIMLQNLTNGKIINNTLSGSYYGIYLDKTNQTIVELNKITNMSQSIFLQYSYNNVINDNHLKDGGIVGIYIFIKSSFNTIENNYVSSMKNHGFAIISSFNSIYNNTFAFNLLHGINQEHSGAFNNSYYNNTVFGNSKSGIYFGNTLNNTLQNNFIYSNSEYGIYLHANSQSNLITKNKIFSNGLNDLYDGNPSSNNVGTNQVGHSPIDINDNTNFEYQATNEGWKGDGTENNPYIIENYVINLPPAIGIKITNTDIYFKIQNVWINGTWTSYFPEDDGIYFLNVSNSKLINNEVTNSYNGLKFIDSDNNFLTNNLIKNNYLRGFYISGFKNNVTNNHAMNNYQGFHLQGLNTSLSNNIANNNSFGYSVRYGYNNSITNNIALENEMTSFNIENSIDNLFIDNTATNNEENGFRLFNSYKNLFYNNSASDNQYGYYLQKSDNNTLNKNKASENKFSSFKLVNSKNNSLISNEATRFGNFGYELLSSNLTILKNNFVSNFNKTKTEGIQLNVSNFNLISNNTVLENYIGINLYFSDDNTINDNKIRDSVTGITIQGKNNVIRQNSISNNEKFGIFLKDSTTNNHIQRNLLSNNGVNGYDNSTTKLNYWIFNSYDDYLTGDYYQINGTAEAIDMRPLYLDLDSDRLPDWFEIKYNLDLNVDDSNLDPDNDGLTNYQEYLLETNPQISNNKPIIKAVYIDTTIYWNAESVNASSFTIFLNGELTDSGEWISGQNNSLSIDTLVPGTYNFTIVLTDDYGHSTKQSLYLTIPEPLISIVPTEIPTTIINEITTTIPTTVSDQASGTANVTRTVETTIISQIVETISKTSGGFGLVLAGIGLLGLMYTRRKR